MSKKFDTKLFQGERITRVHAKYSSVSVIWKWDPEKGCYERSKSKSFLVRTRVQDPVTKKSKRVSKAFDTISDALTWLHYGSEVRKEKASPPFNEILKDYEKNELVKKGIGTQRNEKKTHRLWFDYFNEMPIDSIKSSTISAWIDWMRESLNRYGKERIRMSFLQELKHLKNVLSYYEKLNEDEFQMPIKNHHRERAILPIDMKTHSQTNNLIILRQSFLSEKEFSHFRDDLKTRLQGYALPHLATIQYWHACRISEVAALKWEDIDFEKRMIFFRRHFVFGHSRNDEDIEVWGLKASQRKIKRRKNEERLFAKIHPMYPESYESLIEMRKQKTNKSEYVFFDQIAQSHFRYAQIKNTYTAAFKKVNIPFTGTHIMRHSGASRVWSDHNNYTLLGELLGNVSRESIDIYCHRDLGALQSYISNRWLNVPDFQCSAEMIERQQTGNKIKA